MIITLLSFPADTGDKVAGIKAVRALMGLGLKEAKQVIEGLQSSPPVPYTDDGVPNTDTTDEALTRLRSMGTNIEVKPSASVGIREQLRTVVMNAIQVDQLDVAAKLLAIMDELSVK